MKLSGFRKIAFDGMDEGVKALIGGECRRHREHELWIDNREFREAVDLTIYTDLFLCFRVGDHTAAVDFAARTGSGRNCHEWQRGIFNFPATAGAGLNIVPDMTRVGGSNADSLAAVLDGSTAERDREITLFFTEYAPRKPLNLFGGGIDA